MLGTGVKGYRDVPRLLVGAKEAEWTPEGFMEGAALCWVLEDRQGVTQEGCVVSQRAGHVPGMVSSPISGWSGREMSPGGWVVICERALSVK